MESTLVGAAAALVWGRTIRSCNEKYICGGQKAALGVEDEGRGYTFSNGGDGFISKSILPCSFSKALM